MPRRAPQPTPPPEPAPTEQKERIRNVAKCGHVSKPVELRYKDNGNAWCWFGLAVRKQPIWQHKPDDPEPPSTEVDFYEVVCFGTLAEHVAMSLSLGMRVLCIGNGEIEKWTDNEGKARTNKKILADACGPDLRFAASIADVEGEPF